MADPSPPPVGQPRVSIALATYNGEKFIGELLDSLVRQTWMPWEIIASDDASSDATLALLRSYSDQLPLRILAHERQSGIVPNFNRALEACTGDYVALADQDDVWLPEKIGALMCEMIRMEKFRPGTPVLVFSNLAVVDEELNPIAPFHFLRSVPEIRERQRLTDLMLRNSIPGCAMLVNRALLQRALPIPPAFFMHDWWLALTAAAFGVTGSVDAALIQYRQHDSNACGTQRPVISSATALLRPSTWKQLAIAAESRERILKGNFTVFWARYAEALSSGARKEASLFWSRFQNPVLRPVYSLRIHSSLRLWRLAIRLAQLADKY